MAWAISHANGVNLQLRDIRLLTNIPEEIRHALHPGTPVYFRVDLLKALIADYMITSPEEEAECCVVTDGDVMPMNAEHLFDQRTRGYLKETGHVFQRMNDVAIENSFFIFNRKHPDLAVVHKRMIIGEVRAAIRTGATMDSQFVYKKYWDFTVRMDQLFIRSRKSVLSPTSQFKNGDFPPSSDHRSETFCFILTSKIPRTLNGRNYHNNKEGASPIPALVNWKEEPLLG